MEEKQEKISTGMKIATVIPLENKSVLDDLTYFTSQEVARGDIVTVAVRNKKTLALVVGTEDVSRSKEDIKTMPFNLKKIMDTKGPSIFRPEFFDSVLDTGKYFGARKSAALAYFIPAVFKEKYDKISRFDFSSSVVPPTPRGDIRAEKLLLQIAYEDRISFYKTLIRESFASKKSVFIVLPSPHDIDDFHKSLAKGIENFTVVLHSGLPPKKMLSGIEQGSTGSHPLLILGTPPFLAVPRGDLGTIVLEHESSGAYKTIAKPYFDLRVFVEIFAAKIGAKLIMGDSLLSFETIGRRETDGFAEVHPLSFRLNFQGGIEIIGREKKFKILSDKSKEEMEKNMQKKKNTFVFSLRKGLATLTVCRDCQEPLMCKNCSAPVVLYLSRDGKKRMFVCNRCKNEMDADTICQKCGSWNLVPLGIGTDLVLGEVRHAFEKIGKEDGSKILKLDKESAKTKKGAEGIVREFEENPGSILVGTEMAFFYMNEPVWTSIIASFDSLFSIPNWKMNEKIIQIITAIMRRTENKIIIQTKNPDDSAIKAIIEENLLPFVREELSDRQELGYPPFMRFIKIRHLGDKQEASKAKLALSEVFAEYDPEIFSGFMSKEKGKYVTNALLKLSTKSWSLPELSLGGKIDEALSQKLSSLPREFEVSVDPDDLL